MLLTLGQANAPTTVIQYLFNIQHRLSPNYYINWDQILGELVERADPKTFCFLARCSIATRVSAIGVKHFLDAMTDDYWMGDNDYRFNRQAWRTETLTKLEYYESEYRKLEESTSLLELALWKIRIDNSILEQGDAIGRGNTKMKFDQSDFRLQCRVSCGADHVVENVWPYLLPPNFVRSYIYFNDEDDEDEIEDVDDFIENIDDEEENEEH
jgi:hypothetical protein